jgi:hypothetical protein
VRWRSQIDCIPVTDEQAVQGMTEAGIPAVWLRNRSSCCSACFGEASTVRAVDRAEELTAHLGMPRKTRARVERFRALLDVLAEV